jgi:hypothetical protein
MDIVSLLLTGITLTAIALWFASRRSVQTLGAAMLAVLFMGVTARE